MPSLGEVLLCQLLAYLINLASGERTAAITASREAKLAEALAQEELLQQAVASTRSIRDEVRGACVELARNRATFNILPHEEPLWQLLSDDIFQSDLTEWLMAGGIEEGNSAKIRLLQTMELALSNVGVSVQQLAFLKSSYFDALEKKIYANPILASWRHQLSLDYLREQVSVLRGQAEEAAGVFSAEKQAAAIERYCEKALAAWDIIDLSNLPEGDIHMATQKLLLRQLYMPLRIEVEVTRQGDSEEAALVRMEEQREARRLREAGHFLVDEADSSDRRKTRASVGELLAASLRLVVLGDPGGGKTTMLRWMATAFLLQHKGDSAFSQIPDSETLPQQPWVPVLIRCRDLGEQDLCRCFTDFLTQHLNKTELLPDEAAVMRAVILERIAKGEALLLVDGLDEITNPRVRMMFCQELERTAARYPAAPIVITSRIVGYRDMPYRMGSVFKHGQIAELNREDKDLFARRWVEVTEQHQSSDEKAKRAKDLLDALHSNDRIERLTGNPMLLTTLALVKRKVGKLPNKRTKLYAEAVSVLLNWNPRLYETIEEDEAIPQLEYLAYEMCRRGVQRLPDDEALGLLDRLRIEYPNIRAIKRRDAYEFLKHLEERSSILIKSGGIWQKSTKQEMAEWEFRHLSFQEYLAARALLDGRYPGRDRTKSLAEQIGPLAGILEKAKFPMRENLLEVAESWRESLQLLVADCKDDDVDDVLLSILRPMSVEDNAKTQHPRTVLAARCLADEPNIAEQTAQEILKAFATVINIGDGSGYVRSLVDRTALEIGSSLWSEMLKRCLVEEYCRRSPEMRSSVGGVWGMSEVTRWERHAVELLPVFEDLVNKLNSRDRIEMLSAALVIMQAAFEEKAVLIPGLIDGLFALFELGGCESHAAAWALLWLNGGFIGVPQKSIWSPSEAEFNAIVNALNNSSKDHRGHRRYLTHILARVPNEKTVSTLVLQLPGDDFLHATAILEALVKLDDKRAVAPLLDKLDDGDSNFRRAVIHTLGQLGDKQAVSSLLTKLTDTDTDVRIDAAAALHVLGEPSHLARLIASDDAGIRRAGVRALGRYREWLPYSVEFDVTEPLRDPQLIISLSQMSIAARRFNLSSEQVSSRFEALAAELKLKLSWEP